VDQLYYEEGYIDTKYHVYTADAVIVLEPYLIEGYLPADYFSTSGSFALLYCDPEIVIGMLLEAQAYLTSEFAFLASVSKLVDTSASIQSVFTQTAIGSRDRDIDLFAFSNAAIAVQVNRIRQTNITASVSFDVAVDFVVSRNADSDVDAIFSAIINGLRSRDTNLETQAAFSFDLNSVVNKDTSSGLSTAISMSISGDRIRYGNSTIFSEVSLNVNAQRLRNIDTTANSEFTISILGRKIRDAHLTGTGIASLVCNNVKTTETILTFNLQFTQTLLGGKLKVTAATMTAYAFIFASRNIGQLARPRNLTDNFINSLPTFDSSIKKFGTYSLSGGINLNFGYYGQNKNVIPYQNEDFYLEVWFYPTATGGSYPIGGLSEFLQFRVQSGAFRFQPYISNTNGGVYVDFYRYTHTSTFSANQWYHLAAVKQNNSIAYYINGSRVYYYNESTPDALLPINRWGDATNTTYTSTIGFYAQNGRVDEAFYIKGSTYGFNTTDTSISVPTSARTDTTGVQYLYHFDNDVNDDTRITFSVGASLTSTATQTAAIGYITSPVIAITLQAAVSAVIGKLEEINLVAFTNGALSADINVQRTTEAAFNSASSITISQNRLRDNNSLLTAQVNVDTNAERFRDISSNISAISTVSASVNQNANAESSIANSITLSAVIGKLEEINLVAFTNGALSADINVQRTTEAAFNSASSITISQNRLRDNNSLLTAQVNVDTNAERFRDISSNISAISTVSASVNQNANAESSIANSITLSAVIGKLEEINLVAFTNGALSASVVKTVQVNISLISTATTSPNVNLVANSSASISSLAILGADNYRVKFGSTSANIVASISATPVLLLGIIANISSQFITKQTYFEVQGEYLETGYFEEFEIVVEKIARGIAGIAAQTTLQANIGGSFFAQLTTASLTAVTANVVKTTSSHIDSDSSFSVTADINVIAGGVAELASAFTQLTIAQTGGEIAAQVFNAIILVATANAIKPFNVALSSQSSVYAFTQDSLNANANAEMSAAFTSLTLAVKRVSAEIVTDSVASSLIVAVKDVATDIVCESQFTTSINAVKITGNIITAQTIASTNIVARRRVAGVSTINAQTTLNVTASLIRRAIILTQAVASELVAVARIAAFFVDADVIFTLTSTLIIKRNAQSVISSTSALSANVGIVKSAQIQQQIVAAVSARISITKRYSVTMSSAMTFVVAIRDLRIDEIEYKIPGEGWEYIIAGETRIHIIQTETRLREIQTETSLRNIGSETRIYNID